MKHTDHRALLFAVRPAFQHAPNITAKTQKSSSDCQESLALNLMLTVEIYKSEETVAAVMI